MAFNDLSLVALMILDLGNFLKASNNNEIKGHFIDIWS